jgi:hypothetical protein
MTNVLMLVSTALVAVIAQQGLHPRVIPLTVALMVVGAYGWVAAAKYYERFASEWSRSQDFLQRLDDVDPDVGLIAELHDARRRQLKAFPVSARVNLSYVWITLFVLQIVAGAALTIMSW